MAEFPLKSVAKNASQNDRRNRMNSGTQWPIEEWPNPRECIEEWIAELPTPERRRHEMVQRIVDIDQRTKWPKSENGSKWPNAERPNGRK